MRPLQTEELRFSKIGVALDHWCGITKPGGQLVCIYEDGPLLEGEGPFVDFDLHQDLAVFHWWCAATAEGQVICNDQPQSFEGRAQHVAVGFFNACASDAGHVECFFSTDSGGVEPPRGGGPISVDGYSLCFVPPATSSAPKMFST